MISTTGAYKANLKVLAASDEMKKELLKIKE
jgi:flagellar hook protein FlgE